MARLTRRRFVKQAAVAGSGLATVLNSTAAGRFEPDLGFQLYTLREILATRAGEAFGALAKAGYKKVEVLREGLEQLAPMMKAAGLTPVSGHFDSFLVTGNWEAWTRDPGYTAPPKGYDWAAAIAQATNLGLKYMVLPYLTPRERGGLDSYRRLADRMNKAGEESNKSGIRFCYHHHSFEFAPVEGRRPFDILVERCDKRFVSFEVDVFWVSVAGHDPVEILQVLSGRVPLLHVKDKAKGTAQSFSEEAVPPGAFKEVGSGVLDVPAILRAAASAGVQEYFVEQDQCPGDPVDSLTQSYRYLRQLSL